MLTEMDIANLKINSNAAEEMEQTKDLEIVYLDQTALSPPPRRDYFRLLVTSKAVKLTQWAIGHRIKRSPSEISMPLSDWNLNEELLDDVVDIFGVNTMEYINNVSIGKIDWINHLPAALLAKIVVLVGIKELHNMSAVNRNFQKICSSNLVWKEFFFDYKGERIIEHDVTRHAKFASWRSLFFMNRLEENVFPGKNMVFGHNPLNPCRRYSRQLRMPMEYRPWALDATYEEKAKAHPLPKNP